MNDKQRLVIGGALLIVCIILFMIFAIDDVKVEGFRTSNTTSDTDVLSDEEYLKEHQEFVESNTTISPEDEVLENYIDYHDDNSNETPVFVSFEHVYGNPPFLFEVYDKNGNLVSNAQAGNLGLCDDIGVRLDPGQTFRICKYNTRWGSHCNFRVKGGSWAYEHDHPDIIGDDGMIVPHDYFELDVPYDARGVAHVSLTWMADGNEDAGGVQAIVIFNDDGRDWGNKACVNSRIGDV